MVESTTETRVSLTMIIDQILFQKFDLGLCSLYTDAAIFLMTGMSYAFWHTFSVICEVSSLFLSLFVLSK